MDLATMNGEAALAVRGVKIRKPNAGLLPIGEVAKLCGVINPQAKDYNGTDEEKAAHKALWKTFAKEYNEMREKVYQQNDAAAALVAKQFQAKGLSVKHNKAGGVASVSIRFAPASQKTQSEMLRELAEELQRAKQELAALKASKSDKQ